MAEEVGVAFVRLVPSMRGFGPEAQRAMNDAMQGPARNAGQEAGGEAGGKFGQAFKGALLGAGVLAGAALIGGVTEALDQGKIVGKLRAQLGATPAEAKKYGDIAGSLYANAVTEDFQGAADTIQATMRAGLLPPDATNKQIESISTRLSDVATLMEEDVGQTARAVGKMIKTGLADNATEALDILTRGVQTGANEADDLLDTFSEYSTQFRSIGLTGEQAMGLISQGLKGGARDADVVADSIKEFSIEAVAGGKRVRGGFASLKLDADDMVKKFAAGGPTAAKAFDTVLDKLRGIEDPAKRNAVAIELFGTKAEDMAGALDAMDPSTAVNALGDVAGAADKAGTSLRDNAGTKLTQFSRGVQQNVVEFLGGTVIPAMDDFRGYVTSRFSSVWADAAKGSDGSADRIINFFTILGQRLVQKIAELAPKAVEGLIGIGGKVADFVTANPEKVFKIGLIAAALILAIVALPILVGAALSASAALMMIGFAKRLISSLEENLPKWWRSFTGWVASKATAAASVFAVLGSAIGRWFGGLWSKYVAGPVSRQWDSLITSVRALPGRATSALGGLAGALRSRAAEAGRQLVSATREKVTDAVERVKALPGRAKSALSNLGGTLASAGRNLIQGFIDGIKAKFGDVRSVLGDLTGSLTSWKGPEDLDKRLLTPAGRLLISGFQRGIDLQTPSLRSQLRGLTETLPTTAASAIPASAGAGAGTGGGTAPAGATVVIDGTNMPRALEEWLRHNVRTIGGGSADKWLGQGVG